MVTRPASVLAAHGAGSSSRVFAGWERSFDSPFLAVDLHAGLDVARAGMADYAERVFAAGMAVSQPTGLVGWSMGGLVVMLAAARLTAAGQPPAGLVLLEPSAPGEVCGFQPGAEVAVGTFDPEAVYGSFPADQPARAESVRARGERKRGISIASLPSPTLVVSGREFPKERGELLARHYGAAHVSYPALGHWELVRDRGVMDTAARFLRAQRGPLQKTV